MNLVKEFKEFINRGNVIDLAVGIVIGAAFTKIVSSFVNDLISPLIGLMIGTTDFAAWKLTLKQAAMGADGKEIPAVSMNVGSFLEASVDFIIVAFAVFLLVKAYNTMKKKEEVAPSTPAPPSKEEVLLSEIRDLLKK